jgi:hypothetical protein
MKSIKKYLPIIILITLAGVLRFSNLGYSEFQDDEKKALFNITFDINSYEFLINQRKGPVQFIVTGLTLRLINNQLNETALRLPFTIANILAVIIFYLILKELFKSETVSFFGSLLFLLNGFIVGFSRIAQYQNLNLLFSLSSLYFFIRLSITSNRVKLFSLLGTLFFCLSLLSHWDAVFFIVPISYFYYKFLSNNSLDRKVKIKTTVLNIVLGCVILLPFLIPYIFNQLNHRENMEYFDRRVGVSTYSWDRHKFIFELYNPFLAIYFLPTLGFIGTLNRKRNLLFLLWFLINLLCIRYFMQKPGTHIYNYVIPLILLASSGLHLIFSNRWTARLLILPIMISISFLYFQSYKIFVDHKQEYPWDKKQILSIGKMNLSTEEYSDKEILTFGFPHFRNWREINNYVINDQDICTYISSEGKEITQIYMGSKYGIMENRTCYFVIDVKKPFNTRAKDSVFAETIGKKPMYIYERDGEKLVKVYKIFTK